MNFNLTSVPMQKNSKQVQKRMDNQIQTTTNYHLFKSIDGNRSKNQLHIKRLKNSMRENYLFTVITVNENYEIIDGQHRFEVIKELGLPLNYLVCEGYGLNEVQVLNQNSKNWTADDYLDGYVELGMKQYILYKRFKDEYGLGHAETRTLLSGSKDGGDVQQKFKHGEFVVKDWGKACKTAEMINLIGQYYSGHKRRAFVYAMIYLLNLPQFEFTEFLHKLKIQPTALVDCTTSTQYVSLIEEIYNYKRREKVNLRFY